MQEAITDVLTSLLYLGFGLMFVLLISEKVCSIFKN